MTRIGGCYYPPVARILLVRVLNVRIDSCLTYNFPRPNATIYDILT